MGSRCVRKSSLSLFVYVNDLLLPFMVDYRRLFGKLSFYNYYVLTTVFSAQLPMDEKIMKSNIEEVEGGVEPE
jgi:hypothetical protein